MSQTGKKTYVMFTVGWEVRYNMRDEALTRIDYFVDNDSHWHGKTFLGKEIKSADVLRNEDPEHTIVFVGSLAHRAVITYQLNDMGFVEGRNLFWAPNWHGDEVVPPFYYEKNRWPKLFVKNMDLIGDSYFRGRIEIVASMCRWEDFHTVVDLGAGAMLIKKYLSPETNYIPVDFIPFAPGTCVCNLDEYEFPVSVMPKNVDCTIILGTLEHVRNWRWLLTATSKVSPRILVGLVALEIMPSIKERAEHGFVSHIYTHDLIIHMQELGYKLTVAKERHQLDNIYLFERTAD